MFFPASQCLLVYPLPNVDNGGQWDCEGQTVQICQGARIACKLITVTTIWLCTKLWDFLLNWTFVKAFEKLWATGNSALLSKVETPLNDGLVAKFTNKSQNFVNKDSSSQQNFTRPSKISQMSSSTPGLWNEKHVSKLFHFVKAGPYCEEKL